MTISTSVATEQYNSTNQLSSQVESCSSGSKSTSFKELTRTREVSICKVHWELIPRANDHSKKLQEKAINLLSVFEFELRSVDVLIVNHIYLSRITKCKQDQNVNLLKQLANIFDISFHTKLVVYTKSYRNCYTIKHTNIGKQIIKYPLDSVTIVNNRLVGGEE